MLSRVDKRSLCASRHVTYIGDKDGIMAVATLGKIDEFDPSKEEWPQYVKRLGHFFTANDINSAEKKRAVFLAVCWASNV